MAADDRYTIPASGGVLKNNLGLATVEAVDRAMNRAASTEWAILIHEPMPDRLDLDYLCAIHRRLLSPVLEWAGQLRAIGDEVVAQGTGVVYARSEYYRAGLDDVFRSLASEDYLRGLDVDAFASRLAERWGYLTAVHPFRDGNTRTQSAYFDRLAARAGHQIDWQRIDVPTLRELRLRAVTGSERPLGEYLRDRLVPFSALTSQRAGPLFFGETRDATRQSISDRIDRGAAALRQQGASLPRRPDMRGPSR